MTAGPVTYARRLGLFSGTMAVIGGIIGSGIFLNPAIVVQRTGSAGLTLGVWVAGGAVALLGAGLFAELGARVPRAGGGYVYLREAFGPLPAFLYAWALLLMIATGAIAAVAWTFGSYAADLAGLPPRAIPALAAGTIALLTVLNCLGIRPGAWTTNLFTVLKLAALALLILAGLSLPAAGMPCVPPTCTPLIPPAGLTATVAAVGTALVPVLFAYGGWQQTNFIAEELVDAERTLPRALGLGVAGVVAVYLLANLAYLRALGPDALAQSTAPAAETLSAAFGPGGRRLIAAGIVASTFGFLNFVILGSPRVYRAMAADGAFPTVFARLHPRWRTPVAALLLQGAWAVLLVLTGTYGQLLDWVTFADWIFFGSTAATLLVFRARERRAGGPPASQPAGRAGPSFRMPALPLALFVFIGAAGYVVFGSVASNPGNAVRGTLLLLAGVAVFFGMRRRASPPSGESVSSAGGR